MPTIEVRVVGRVQGVGFRAFVSRLAGELGLRGEVWNSVDGSVRGVLQADEEGTLEEAVRRLAGGPGRVDRIERREAPGEREYEGFQVVAGGRR